MKYALAAVAMVLACSAYAGNDNANPCGNNGNNCNIGGGQGGAGGNGGQGGNGGNGGNSSLNATLNGGTHVQTQVTSNTNKQAQGQIQGQQQNAVSSSAVKNSGNSVSLSAAEGGSANNQGNSLSVTNVNPDKIEVRSVGIAPDAIANPTAPCRVAVGASLGIMGGAGGISGSVLDEGCDAREDARLLHNLGLKMEAIQRLCQKKEMRDALSSFCPVKEEKKASFTTKNGRG